MSNREQGSPEELLPCGYCGSDDIKTFRAQTSKGNVEYVQCMNCCTCGPDHIEGRHWNKRAWRSQAAEWLRQRAVYQEQINAECPAHAAAYQLWRDAPIHLRMYANEVEAGK